MATCDQQFSTPAVLMFVAAWQAVTVRLWHRVAISHHKSQPTPLRVSHSQGYTLSLVELLGCVLCNVLCEATTAKNIRQKTYTLSQSLSSTRYDLCVVNGHVAQKHKQHCAHHVLFATHTFARTKHILWCETCAPQAKFQLNSLSWSRNTKCWLRR